MIAFADTLTRLPLSPRIKYELAQASRLKVTRQYTAITVEPKDIVAGKNRAEFKIMDIGEAGTQWEYEYGLYIPGTFKPCSTYEILGQLHDGKPKTGEWKSIPPPLAMRHFADDSVDFVYGIGARQNSPRFHFARGTWHQITWRVLWSLGADGLAECYLDRKPVWTERGANLPNAAKPYWKLGIYRPNGGASGATVRYRNCSAITL